ncbi:MAG: transposase [Rhodobacteraceae bacterium]|nr:transposase [Paracoccaceae bacterium]
MNQIADTARFSPLAGEAGFDPIEDRLRANVRATIEAVFEEELGSFLGRLRYDRGDGAAKGYRHGHRERQLTGTFGTETIRVPRARIEDDAGKVTEWRSRALPRYQRLTKKAEALIAAVCLSETDTRRVKRALYGLFEGAVSKDVVSRAWRRFLEDLDTRGLKRPEFVPEFVIVDGAPGLEAARVALWGEDLPIQRCTARKHRNLLAHAPKPMQDEVTEDDRDMIYADTAAEIETRRKAFLRKWRLKCRAVADSLEQAGDRLFAFTRLDPSQWKSARTTNAIKRLNGEFRRRIKTQTVLPCAETVPMLLWALLASGQIQMRKVDGWETLSQPLAPMPLDLAA